MISLKARLLRQIERLFISSRWFTQRTRQYQITFWEASNYGSKLISSLVRLSFSPIFHVIFLTINSLIFARKLIQRAKSSIMLFKFSERLLDLFKILNLMALQFCHLRMWTFVQRIFSLILMDMECQRLVEYTVSVDFAKTLQVPRMRPNSKKNSECWCLLLR